LSPRRWDSVRLVLAIVGAGIMGYLTLVHYQGESLLACPGGGAINCHKALTSPQAELFGVPTSIFGLLWFLVAGSLAVRSLSRAPGRVAIASLAWTGAATVVVLYLVYAELALIHALCLWCTATHVIILTLLVIEVLTYPHRPTEARAADSFPDTLPT
jgi:uncharacterized membrane protein